MEQASLNSVDDPFEFFARWMTEAENAEMIEPHAMTLATVSADGKPSARQVLLKGHGESGFVFYTNYQSRKADELADNPNVSAVIWWDKLYRQVRIEGEVRKLAAELSSEYFASRPRGSQISAWASAQSAVIADYASLHRRVAQIEKRFDGLAVERPDYWGGYSIIPNSIEFWQGRQDRLHERLRYARDKENWVSQFLSP